MLKKKLKECKKCRKDKVIWSNGMCIECTDQSNFDTNVSFGMGIRAQLKKTRKAKPKNKEFFESQAAAYQETPISFESGRNLGVITNVNLAHVFPKQTYKSLAHEPQNIILLSWEEHSRFDELIMGHEFEKLETEFKSWSKICERIKILLPLCKEQGKLRTALEEYLYGN